jgi:Porin subfamily
MARRIVSALSRAVFRATGAGLLLAVMASAAAAQTLNDPAPPAKWSPPAKAAKSTEAARVRACSAFGAGFVNVPGTDACVKIGGGVTVEGSARR